MPDGRSIATPINTLLSLPFHVKLATRDWHPSSHISFAANHASASPYTSTTTITHPATSSSYETTLWPVHCVQDTTGAQLIPELDASLLDGVIDKGMAPDREMYSAFYDPFKENDSGLASRLRDQAVTHVYVVGLASDFCVKATAEHARDEGFKTYIVDDAAKPVFPDKWPEMREQLTNQGIGMITTTGREVEQVKALTA